MGVPVKNVYQVVADPANIHTADEFPPPKGLGVRHTQALLFFICLSIAFMMRAHMGVTLVAMTENAKRCTNTERNTSQFNSTIRLNETDFIESNFSTGCNQSDSDWTHIGFRKNEISRWSAYRTYNWTKSNQDMIIFAFFVGYTSMMIPMGLAAHRTGGKATIVLALVVNGLVSLVTPWLPLIGGWQLVAVGRLLQGMTQATMYPSVHTLLARWAPLIERGRLSTYVYTGSHVGTVVAFQTAGQLAGSAAGWPTTMWVCATLSLAAAALLSRYGATSPDAHPGISTEEKLYITGHNLVSRNKKLPTPWWHILTSSAVWGLYAAHAGSAINYLFILTQTPVYMNRVIGLDIKTNGLYSSLPYVAMYGTTLAFGWAADRCIAGGMSVVNVRRLANTFGLAVSGIFMALFSMMQSPVLAELLLITCMALHSGVHVGFHINHIDLAPNFAGPMMSLGNMLANVVALSVPALVAAFVHDLSDQKQWQMAFMTIAGVGIVANAIFVVLGRGDVQPWNDLSRYSITDVKTEEIISMKVQEKDSIQTKLQKDCEDKSSKLCCAPKLF